MANLNILSPHYDDAVLSAWRAIERNNAQVTTIFTGTPEDTKPSTWDRLTGFQNSSEAMKARRLENERALEDYAGRIVNLGFLEYQYRAESPSAAIIADAVIETSPHGAQFLVAAGLSKINRPHKDHVLVRQVGQELLARGNTATFMVDIPYMLPAFRLNNWPSRLSLDQIQRQLGMRLQIEPRLLTEEEQAHKRAAYLAYRSQLRMIGYVSLNGLGNPRGYTWEVELWPR